MSQTKFVSEIKMTQTMEALRLSQPQPHLLLLRNHRHIMHHTTLHPNPRFKSFITTTAAAISKPVEMVSVPVVETPVASPRLKVSPDSLQYPPGYVGAVPDRSRGGDEGDSGVSAMSYLTSILTSKVYDVAVESPLELAPKLSERLGVNVWLKREDLQPVSTIINSFLCSSSWYY